MDKEQLTLQIKQAAHQLGFTLAGVTSPDPPSHFGFFQRWIKNGYAAEMNWIATTRSLERRSDPRRILNECKSILVLAAPYPPPRGNVNGGNISAYALNLDYHDVLEDRIRKLITSIENKVGRPVSNRWYIDTGPVLEKELAMRAGLGWIGKNTLLINQQLGSYFYLSEILLDIELAYDPAHKETYCGSCTMCLDTCPTGALTKPYTLDANRCISYLTIEHRGELPKNLCNRMGDWIFGCDICQIVCPWNKPGSEVSGILTEFIPRDELANLDLVSEMGLSPADFSTRFKGSPVKRAKRKGYLRNVAVALGNQKNEIAIPALTTALTDQEPLIRSHAAWALGEIGNFKSMEYLKRQLDIETDPDVISAIKHAMDQLDRS